EVPAGELSNGAVAIYDLSASNPPAGVLTFDYAVRAGDRASDLAIRSFDTNGATVRSASGVDADLSAVTNFDLGVAVNVAVVSDIKSSVPIGDVDTGQTVALTVSLSEGVLVDTTSGIPTLALGNGTVASYDAGASNPSAGTLVFDYTVAANDYTTDLT